MRKKIKYGFPPGEIHSYLKDQDYADKEIDELLQIIAQQPAGKPKDSDEKKAVSKVGLLGMCLFITGLSIQSISDNFFMPNILVVTGLMLIMPWLFQKMKKHFTKA